ncbi:hypothetical protein Hanom_Chr05g00397801 [Helianthus anomalus]
MVRIEIVRVETLRVKTVCVDVDTLYVDATRFGSTRSGSTLLGSAQARCHDIPPSCPSEFDTRSTKPRAPSRRHIIMTSP